MQPACHPQMKRRQVKWWLRLVDLDHYVVHSGTLYRQLKFSERHADVFSLRSIHWWSVAISSHYNHKKSRNSSVIIATGYELDYRNSIPGKGKRFFSTPQRLECIWGPPNLLSNGCHGLCPRVCSGRGVKLTTYLYLMPRSRMLELFLHSPYVFMAWCLVLLSIGKLPFYLHRRREIIFLWT
jgi:hypothetical protein